MKQTLAILSFLVVAALVSGCGLCPIEGFNNVGTIQTSYFQLDKKVPANTVTLVGNYEYLQNVNLPPGRAFFNVDYADDSRKKKRSDLCFRLDYFRQNSTQPLFFAERCARITKNRGAEVFFDYASGFAIQQGDSVTMSFTSSKALVKDVGLFVTAGYQLFSDSPQNSGS